MSAPRVKKVRRSPAEGELAIEQIGTLERVNGLLEAAGLNEADLPRAGICCLCASLDTRPVGVAVVRTTVDLAGLLALFVTPKFRRRGIGMALLTAARAAANTRGARLLYVIASPEAEGFLRRTGFAPLTIAEARMALEAGSMAVCLLAAHELEADLVRHPLRENASRALWSLDISQDGIVAR